MPRPVRTGRPHFPHIRLTLAVLAWLAAPAAAQELPLKQSYPGATAFSCPAAPAPGDPGEEARDQATRLGSDAAQAVLLGDLDRARELLARATEVDPTSAELAYRYARILEDQGQTDEARTELCRVVELDSGDPQNLQDARDRLEAMAAAERAAIPDEAVDAYRTGLSRAESGLLQSAEQAFAQAVATAPGWAEAHYNRAVTQARLGRRAEAVSGLRRYLELEPGAEDAMAVSQRIGQLESAAASTTSAGTALTLGLVFPGMGQFYSGRPLGGFSVLALAGGALAAGYFIEEVQVECLVEVPPGQACPPDQAFDEDIERPYMAAGIGAAALVAVIGAVEAYIRARGPSGPPTGEDGAAMADTGVRLAFPTVTARGARVTLNLLRLRF